ncbi:MAG: hypothetical protein JWP89_4263 [Schlesneria sp.]|nr:hypothetical protein [Schlesneria sp.]
MSLQILIIGQTNRAEAQSLMEWIPATLEGARLTQHVGMELAVVELVRTQQIPDLIVVIQSHLDEYCQRDLDELGRLAPLARWVVCSGAWCESEGRTRHLWPLAVRVPLRSAPLRLLDEWRLLCGENVKPLPLSGSREEAFDADHSPLVKETVSISVLVDSPDAEYARYLCELLVESGHAVLASDASGNPSPQVILCDLDPWGPARRQRAEYLQARDPHAQLVGLMSRPEVEVVDEYPVIPKLGSQQQILDAVLQAIAD